MRRLAALLVLALLLAGCGRPPATMTLDTHDSGEVEYPPTMPW